MWGEKGVPKLIAAWTVIINYFTVLASLELDIDKMPNMVVSVATLYWQICYSVWKIHTLATYDTKCFQRNLPHFVSHIFYMWHVTSTFTNTYNPHLLTAYDNIKYSFKLMKSAKETIGQP